MTNHLCALRFFYIQTLKRPWSTADTPYPKKTHRLPTILSQEEIAQLIEAAPTPFYRTILMTLYATGIRNAELTRLKVSDIDSQRMVIHIQGGKGRKDRDVMLSPVLLDELRAHWRRLRKQSSVWLFPGNPRHTGDQPIDTKTPRHVCQYASRRAGLTALSNARAKHSLPCNYAECARPIKHLTLSTIGGTCFSPWYKPGVPQPDPPALMSAIGRWSLSALIVNSMIGSAVFGQPSVVASLVGASLGLGPMRQGWRGTRWFTDCICTSEVSPVRHMHPIKSTLKCNLLFM